jgi:hypothetical protein
MALRDPVAVYNAANNLEAHFVCEALAAAGVEAYPTEDVSQIGTWVGGLVPELHKPQVWVEREDVARAVPVLEDFERRKAELQSEGGGDAGPPIEVVCEECGSQSLFPAEQRGSVQQCPHCGEYLDVGAAEVPEGWEEGGEGGEPEEA